MQRINLKLYLEYIERLIIKEALIDSNGNISKAALMMSMKRTTLIMKAKRLKVKIKDIKHDLRPKKKSQTEI